MRLLFRNLLCILLSLMCLFTCIGYAAITDTLSLTGSVKVSIPSGLFITNIKTRSTTNIDKHTVSYVEYTTTVNSIISRKGNSAGTVIYEITVLNNTDYEYAYRGLYYTNSYGSNSYVSTSNANNKLGVVVSFPNGSVVAPKEKLTFTVTYTEGKNIGANLDLDTFLNFQFGINVDSIDKAYDIVHTKFLEILNTTSTYTQLIEVLDDKFDGEQTWTSNYIGNVGNAVDNDMMTVETLFAGQLTMMINGQPQKAWVMIKHEDVDGNELTGDDYELDYSWGHYVHLGCEMTLYMTVDPLTTANGWAPVYTTVFTCDRDSSGGNKISEWYRVGSTYSGQANIVGYKGEYGQTGSFVTDNWVSYAAYYQITDSYGYSVDPDVSIGSIMSVIDWYAYVEFQNLLTEAEEMIANIKYAGTGITVVEDAYAAASKYYYKDENGHAVAYQDTRRVMLIPHIQDLDYVLSVAQDAIDKIEQAGG